MSENTKAWLKFALNAGIGSTVAGVTTAHPVPGARIWSTNWSTIMSMKRIKLHILRISAGESSDQRFTSRTIVAERCDRLSSDVRPLSTSRTTLPLPRP
jgi:hypothetical protein